MSFEQDIFNLQEQIKQGNIEIDKAQALIFSERVFIPKACKGKNDRECLANRRRLGFSTLDRSTADRLQGLRGQIPKFLKGNQIGVINQIRTAQAKAANAKLNISGAGNFITQAKKTIDDLGNQLSNLFQLKEAQAVSSLPLVDTTTDEPDFIFESPKGVLSSLSNTNTKSLLVIALIVAGVIVLTTRRKK